MGDDSVDSSFELTRDLIDSTPIEKCSLNPRRGKNSKRLLTGFIIYASEVRKEVADQYPDQTFGFISRLVGDKWRELSKEAKFKYHKRALIHNRRIKEEAQRDGITLGASTNDSQLSDGSVKTAKKLTKKERRLAKLSKREQRRLMNGTPGQMNDSSMSESTFNGFNDSTMGQKMNGNHLNNSDHQYGQTKAHSSSNKKTNAVDTSTQTPAIKFIEPPPKKPLMYSKKFIQRLIELRKWPSGNACPTS